MVYNLGPNEEHMGIIEFDKATDKFSILQSPDDGIISNKTYERWAAEKITKILYKENGIFPEATVVEK